jgi:hypothetical protein
MGWGLSSFDGRGEILGEWRCTSGRCPRVRVTLVVDQCSGGGSVVGNNC